MAVLPPSQLAKDITKGKFSSCYYFFGSEDYRIHEAEKFVATSFLPERQLTTNLRRFNGRKTALADLLAELSVYPMLGERQVMVVSDIQSYKPTEIDRIQKLLTPPDPNRIIILNSSSAKSPNKKSAFLKKMQKFADVVVEFGRLSSTQAGKIFSAKLKEQQMTIEPEALNLFTELVAGNRGALEREADKVIQFKQGEGQVTVDDVHQVCSGFEVFSVFQLADAVVAGDRRRLLRMLDQLMASSDVSGTILFHLGQHFQYLYLLKHGKSLPGNRSWLAGKLRPQAARFSEEQLEQSLIDIAATTATIRRDGIKPRLAIETLMLSMVAESA